MYNQKTHADVRIPYVAVVGETGLLEQSGVLVSLSRRRSWVQVPYSSFMAHWSSGQDTGLSNRNREFDSLMRYYSLVFLFYYSVYILKLSLLERRHMDMPKKFITLSFTFIKRLWHSTLVSYASLSGTIWLTKVYFVVFFTRTISSVGQSRQLITDRFGFESQIVHFLGRNISPYYFYKKCWLSVQRMIL